MRTVDIISKQTCIRNFDCDKQSGYTNTKAKRYDLIVNAEVIKRAKNSVTQKNTITKTMTLLKKYKHGH